MQTLKDFQYVDRNGKWTRRERAREGQAAGGPVAHEDRLREERAHGPKTKEKLAQTATGERGSLRGWGRG